jgi:hypothetical protein
MGIVIPPKFLGHGSDSHERDHANSHEKGMPREGLLPATRRLGRYHVASGETKENQGSDDADIGRRRRLALSGWSGWRRHCFFFLLRYGTIIREGEITTKRELHCDPWEEKID